MAIFKCKMCGGTLEINNNETVAVCEYCGTQQTLPKLDDDKRVNMYDRANHFRRNNEFDKAMGIYEQILNEDNSDSEAYWSLVLCRYGIEYVEDPASHKRVPTINRAQFTSIFDDEDYKSALKYADGYQKDVYESEAKAINEIQKGILEISQKEEPFDVFICYKETDNSGRRTPDSVLATELYHELTRDGFKVFFSRITLEDKLGTAYEPYIFAALNSAKVMVVLGTKPEYFNAVWVKNEWSRYLALIKNGAKKMLIPAYKDMDPYDLPEEFSHLQAQDMSKLGFMQDLIRGIKKIAQTDEPKATVVKEAVVTSGNTNIAPFLKRAFMFLEDGDWVSANEYCEKVLDLDPENAEAYLGKLMAEVKVKKQENLKDCVEPFDKNTNYQKVIRFANKNLVDELEEINVTIREQNEAIKKEKTIVLDSKIVKNAFLYLSICSLADIIIYFLQFPDITILGGIVNYIFPLIIKLIFGFLFATIYDNYLEKIVFVGSGCISTLISFDITSLIKNVLLLLTGVRNYENAQLTSYDMPFFMISAVASVFIGILLIKTYNKNIHQETLKIRAGIISINLPTIIVYIANNIFIPLFVYNLPNSLLGETGKIHLRSIIGYIVILVSIFISTCFYKSKKDKIALISLYAFTYFLKSSILGYISNYAVEAESFAIFGVLNSVVEPIFNIVMCTILMIMYTKFVQSLNCRGNQS